MAYRARRRASRKAWYLSTVACVAALCTAAAQAAGQGTLIYVPNAEDNTASVIDSASNATIATIHIASVRSHRPFRSAATKRMSRIASEVGVFAINTATNVGDAVDRRETWRLKTEEHRRYPGRPHAFTSDMTAASCRSTLKPRTIGKTIPMDGSGNIVIAPDGKTAYVGSWLTGIVTPVDLAAGEAGTPIKVGGDNYTAFGLAISPDGKTVYASGIQQSSTDSYIYAIDISTGEHEVHLSWGQHRPVRLGGVAGRQDPIRRAKRTRPREKIR